MKLVEALKTIREECKTHVTCSDCPLRDYDDDCALLELQPDDWEFLEDVPPRIFK
ncbi:MAG: hypothetical protein IKU29_11870 [Parabacteroides sp.]|nr:hypothetical protein [Parabacteroides sp.]